MTYLGEEQVNHPNRSSTEVKLQVDGGRISRPAISQFVGGGEAIGTPSVHSTLTEDIYLTLAAAPQKAGDPATIGILVAPLIAWLWIGGGIIAFGTILAAWPGRRRRPTDAVSAPVPGSRARTGARSPDEGGRGRGGGAPVPVAVGVERVTGVWSARRRLRS